MSIPQFKKCETGRRYIPLDLRKNKRTHRWHATAYGNWRVVSLPKPRTESAVHEKLVILAQRAFGDLLERRVEKEDDVRIELVTPGRLYYASILADSTPD